MASWKKRNTVLEKMQRKGTISLGHWDVWKLQSLVHESSAPGKWLRFCTGASLTKSYAGKVLLCAWQWSDSGQVCFPWICHICLKPRGQISSYCKLVESHGLKGMKEEISVMNLVLRAGENTRQHRNSKGCVSQGVLPDINAHVFHPIHK